MRSWKNGHLLAIIALFVLGSVGIWNFPQRAHALPVYVEPRQTQTGFLEICKESDSASPVSGSFEFTVANQTVSVPVGACSRPIELPAGQVTVTETARPGTMLVGVRTVPTNRLVSSDLATNSAKVQIVAGDLSTQTLVYFKNRTEEQGLLKICKIAGPGISNGTPFEFRVANQATGAEQTVVVPAGSCVVVDSFDLGTEVLIDERIGAGNQLTRITVTPSDRQVGTIDYGRGIVVVRIGSGVTEATFTNRKPSTPTPTTTSATTSTPTKTTTSTPTKTTTSTPTKTPVKTATSTPTQTPSRTPTATVGSGMGRMTGGGSVFTQAGVRVTHGFTLRCGLSDKPQRLQINWDSGNRFHLEQLTSVRCLDDPAIEPAPPVAGIDTYIGTGVGRYNGVSGATVQWIFTDTGEPGVNDRAQIVIKDASGRTVLTVDGRLDRGNHQAH